MAFDSSAATTAESNSGAGAVKNGPSGNLSGAMKTGKSAFGRKPATSGGKLSGKKSGLSETLSRLRAKGALK